MTEATIGCSRDVKERIESIKEEHETFDGVLTRLVENHQTSGEKWTERGIERIVDERIEQQIRR